MRDISILVVVGVLASCSSSSSGPIGSKEDSGASNQDAGTAEAASLSDASDDSAVEPEYVCGARKVTGPQLPIEKVTTIPAGLGSSGGTVVDGHYVSTRFRWDKTVSAGSTDAADLWIKQGRYEWEEDDSNSGLWSSAGTVAINSPYLDMFHECTKYSAPAFRFTATATTLVLSLSDGQGHTLVIDMKKVP